MLIIWIPVSVLAMYFVLNIVYGKLWKNGLQAGLRFEERDVEEGDETILVETVTNDKFLPLPVVKLSFKMGRWPEETESKGRRMETGEAPGRRSAEAAGRRTFSRLLTPRRSNWRSRKQAKYRCHRT